MSSCTGMAAQGHRTRVRIARFVADFHNTYGVAPTIREIVDGLGMRSPGSVQSHIARLLVEGVLKRPELPSGAESARTLLTGPEHAAFIRDPAEQDAER